MIEKLLFIKGNSFHPYYNLAVEEYLLDRVEKDTAILYLWQNENTIVIGKNQNPWKECRMEEMKKDGVHLVRRLSGGGAVFHDLGNLNFTFLLHKDNYDLERQLSVILRGVHKLGIQAEKSGRNDITAEGKKFSGNAFYHKGENCYHHGTLLINADMQRLSRYLQVSGDKLAMKGVDSVKSRVTNLSVYNKEITVKKLEGKLAEAFEEVYGCKLQVCRVEDLEQTAIEERKTRFSSWEWIYGRKIDFQYELSKRFPWGGITWQIQVDRGMIGDLQIFSDAMDSDFMESIPSYVKGCKYDKKDMIKSLDRVPVENEGQQNILSDMKGFLKEAEL